MSKIVRRQTNTATGVHWLRRTMNIAARLGKNNKRSEIQDGYILRANRAGNQRSATLLDMAPHVRVVGNLGTIAGQFLGSPRLKVGGNRDAFHPGAGADPIPLTVEDLDEAQFPTNWNTINIGAAPSKFGVFLGAALPVANDRTKLRFAGRSNSFEDVLFYPLDTSEPLYHRVEFIGRGDTGVAANTNEAFVTAVTGGYVFSPREIDIAPNYPVVLPYAATDFDPVAETIVVATPIVKPIAKTQANTGKDYGLTAIFFTRSVGVTTVTGTTSLFIFNFPASDFFEQSLWFGEEAFGYTPALIQHEAVLKPDGSTTIYGTFLSFLYGTAPEDEEDFREMLTRFKLDVSAAGQPNWSVLKCDVAGFEASLNARRFNSVEGEFEFSNKPVVFYGAGDTWAFWLSYDLTANGLNFFSGGRATASDSSITINKGGAVVAQGGPLNVVLTRDLGELVTFIPLVTARNEYAFSYVACHVDTPEVFGLSFFGWDRTTEELKLCKWDTVDGFGIWEVDLTQMNLRRADRLPGISVYQRCSVVDGEVVGLPSFVANSEYGGGNVEGHIIAKGVAKSMGLVTGLSVSALGNPLQSSPLNKLYKE
jgi:hypothetical protein